MLTVAYVDDIGIATNNGKEVDMLIERLLKAGFELTCEGSFSVFLGIKFVKDPVEETTTLTQCGLIKKIIDHATGMSNCNPNWTPATQLALGSDPDGEEMSESWSYTSIVGMLLYLVTNTCPDIAFAVSQVA